MENNTGHTGKVKGFFNRYSRSWEKNYESGGIMQERTTKFSEALSGRLSEGAHVLDFGCGSGDLTVSLKMAGFNMQGYDLSNLMIKRALERFDSTGILFTGSNKNAPLTLPFDNNTFDAVTASSVFEYIENPSVYFDEIYRVLKPGGFLFLTVPDNRHLKRRIESFKIKFYNQSIIKKLVNKYLPERVKTSLNVDFFMISKTRPSIEKWVEMLNICGLNVKSIPKCETTLTMLIAQRSVQ